MTTTAPPHGRLGRRPRILAIDDDADVISLLEVTLQPAGFGVSACPDGRDALAAALTLLPDVAIVDWVLPSCSGLEICSAIRARPELTGTRIMMVSGRGGKDDVTIGYGAGADRYLVKPIAPRVLLAGVHDLAFR